jgi:hypothetical protein
MTPTAVPRATTPQAASPGATTPQLIKQGMYGSAACALLLLLAVTSGTRTHRDAMEIIGRDTAPGIIAAQRVSASLAGMDAGAVNELLLYKDNQSHAAQKAFDDRRKEAAEVLIAAAENIRYDEERAPIRTLAFGLTSYSEQIQHALDSRPDSHSLDAYRGAASTMDETLLPAAQELDRARRAVFDRTYADQRKWSSAAMLFLVLSSVALIGVLIALQVFLMRRTRRYFNPSLILATGLTFFSFFYFADSFTTADRELKIAKQDAFESIHVLWKARSAAYSASAEESRARLDTAHAAQYQQAFQQKMAQVDGFIADEMKNITFPGESDAANKAVTALALYEKTPQPATLDPFDQAVGETLQINQSALEEAVKSGFDALDNMEIMASVICGAIALLALLGLVPRLREYTAA